MIRKLPDSTFVELYIAVVVSTAVNNSRNMAPLDTDNPRMAKLNTLFWIGGGGEGEINLSYAFS